MESHSGINNSSTIIGTSLGITLGQAKSDLQSLLIKTDEGLFYPAGKHQFGSFWTRDFCLAVPGLLRLGEASVVAAQLEKLLGFRGPHDFIPRGFDCIDPKIRVFRHSLLRFVPGNGPDYKGPLKPEYKGEHGTPAFDSNALVLLALHQLQAADPELFGRLAQKFDFSFLLRAYLPFQKDGLVQQAAFSDWQDSARREGAGLFLHVLLLQAALAAKELNISIPNELSAESIAQKIKSNFFNPKVGLYSQSPGGWQIPLESNLWLLQMPYMESFQDTQRLIQNLKANAVWQRPGIPSTPFSPKSEIAWTTKMVGLLHYHDDLAWSWLLAEQAFAAQKFGDDEMLLRILQAQSRAVEKYKCIHEVYRWQNDELVPFENLLYRSEGPFTWGAARWYGVHLLK